MNLHECKFVLDSSVPSAVLEHLTKHQLPVIRSVDRLPADAIDAEILSLSLSERSVVITQDPDFGTLAVRDGQAFHGIIFLRPGHVIGAEVVRTFEAVLQQELDLRSPLSLSRSTVATRSGFASVSPPFEKKRSCYGRIITRKTQRSSPSTSRFIFEKRGPAIRGGVPSGRGSSPGRARWRGWWGGGW
jgi:predicted nuclease of predicted toxin-antitoxin system